MDQEQVRVSNKARRAPTVLVLVIVLVIVLVLGLRLQVGYLDSAGDVQRAITTITSTIRASLALLDSNLFSMHFPVVNKSRVPRLGRSLALKWR